MVRLKFRAWDKLQKKMRQVTGITWQPGSSQLDVTVDTEEGETADVDFNIEGEPTSTEYLWKMWVNKI